jgi:hypothetical protein
VLTKHRPGTNWPNVDGSIDPVTFANPNRQLDEATEAVVGATRIDLAKDG